MRNRARIWTHVFQACFQLPNVTKKNTHFYFFSRFVITNHQWVFNSCRKSSYTLLFGSLSIKMISMFSLLKCPATPSYSLFHSCWLFLMLLWENKIHEKGIPMSPSNNSGSLPPSLSMLFCLFCYWERLLWYITHKFSIFFLF